MYKLKCRACHRDEVKAAPQLQALTPQYDPFVTWLPEMSGFCPLYLSECGVEILARPLLSILFPATFFFYFCQSPVFPFAEKVAAAAAGFLPEQFFKLFTRRLAALTLCFGSISRGDILPALPCSPAFALLLLKPSNNPSLNRLHAIATWI